MESVLNGMVSVILFVSEEVNELLYWLVKVF